MSARQFPAYKTHQAAASHGCFACCAKLQPTDAKDSGYPPKRGQYVLKCRSCGLSTFFDLRN